MDLLARLIAERTVPWNPDMAADPVQARLLDFIAAKKRGRKRPAKAASQQAPASNVVNIMDALKKSIAAEGKSKR